MMIKPGTVFADRYGIIEKIGTGGMADVYRAKDLEKKSYVALKILKEQFCSDTNHVAHFKREAEAASLIDSDNIVHIYDTGVVSGRYYIAMEYIDGITLKEYIKRKGRLSARETMAIAAQVAVGLSAAHEKNIIHQDIKPQNIILSRNSEVKITDFGIARATAEDTVCINDKTMGSVHYIAPEQAKGSVCDKRSDIYSLGIVIYEMITGRVPFDNDTSVAVLLSHMNGIMTPPSKLNPSCPVALEQIIFRCTQKSRERRYNSATELLSDLRIAVINPDFNFEKREKESLKKSDTMVLPGKMHIVPKRTPKSTIITSGAQKEKESTGVVQVPKFKKRTVKADIDEDIEDFEEFDEKGKAERGNSTVLFKEDKREDERNTFDRFLTAAGILLGAAIVCMVLYIFIGINGQDIFKRDSSKSSKSTRESFDYTTGDEYRNTEEETEKATGFTLHPIVETETEVKTHEEDQFDPETQVKVPLVIGYDISSAVKILDENELNYRISANIVYSDEYDVGIILKQSVAEGAIVEKHSTIIITLSAGTDKFEIKKEYIGGSLSAFKNAVSNYNGRLNISYVGKFSDSVKVNYIISITPGDGMVEADGDIKVVYSKGPEYVTVPDVIGYNLTKAETLLTKALLFFDELTYEYSDEYEKNLIIRQNIAPGVKVKNGSALNLVISKGVETVSFPDVTGYSLNNALSELEGLKLEIVTVEKYAPKDRPGTVLKIIISDDDYIGTDNPYSGESKNPETETETETKEESEEEYESEEETESTGKPGYITVKHDAVIKLFYAVGNLEMPDLSGLSLKEATELLTDLGIKYTTERIPTLDSEKCDKICAQSIDTGEEITPETEVIISYYFLSEIVSVPDSSGFSEMTALQIKEYLEDEGFKVEFLTEATEDAEMDGVFLRIEPSSGEETLKGSTIKVYYSKYEDPEATKETDENKSIFDDFFKWLFG